MKKSIKYITQYIRPPMLVLLAVCIMGNAFGQGGTPLSGKLRRFAKGGSTVEWINFFADSTIRARTIFTDLKDAFGLSTDDKMTITKVNKDAIGFSHYKYQQYYKNHVVLYGEYIIHQQPDSIVKSSNGRLIAGLDLPGTPSIAEKPALDAALQFMHAGKYLWQNPAMESELKRQQKNANATYYPKGDLVYAPNNHAATFKSSDYRLAWHFKIYTDGTDVMAKDVYVDAITGRVIHYTDVAMNCSGGTGTSGYNGSVSINTQLNGGVYRSLNDCQATNIYVYNCGRGPAVNTFYTDADNTWTQQSAVQAQWGAMMTYNYYIGQHSRTSWNNAAGDMIAYNNAVYGSPATANNACWGCYGNNTIFGAGTTNAATDDWNTDDIMGHEFTHGVTQSEAGLDYNKESGGLNESFSDIFGEMVESWAEGNCDYLVGGDRGAIRSMINPKAYGQPDTYLGTNWYNTGGCTPTGNNDNCGVHTNSGVQNHWFYLLSEGGTGTNDNGEAYNVTGITRFKARLIAYRALTEYLTSSSQYIDARKASLQAAWDLYGQCSPEIIAVGDAWHAVGVESQSPAYNITVCGNYPADATFLQAISTLTGGGSCSPTVAASGTTVYFAARDKVLLEPGFKALDGSNFIAYLEPCSSTRWFKTPELIMSDPEKGIKPNMPQSQSVTEASSVATNNINITQDVAVAPNPFTTSFKLSISSKNNVRAQIMVYNSAGAKVIQQPGVNLIKGLNTISLNGSNLASGVYIVEVNFGDSKIVKKIIKAK